MSMGLNIFVTRELLKGEAMQVVEVVGVA